MELTDIIRSSIPAKIQATGGHPAKRTFQAIRIELNRELEVLEDSLDGMIGLLNDGGRICVITFHSLEDRIVKNIFRKNENPCTCPPDFPVCVCGKMSKGQGDHQKADPPGGGGDGGESQIAKVQSCGFSNGRNRKRGAACRMKEITMAAMSTRQTIRRSTTARNRAAMQSRRMSVVDGNTARRLQEAPVYVPAPRRPAVRRKVEEQPVQKAKTLSASAQRNRERAAGIGKGYVLFLAGICMLILVICVHYLQLQTLITRRMKEVAALESELTQLKEDNDAYYSQVTSDIDLSEIKKIAIGRLGMKYPAEDQIMTYETEGRSYVRQFQDVPGAK